MTPTAERHSFLLTRLSHNRWFIRGLALIVGLCALTIGLLLSRTYRAQLVERDRASVQAQVDVVAAELESELNRRQGLVNGLAAFARLYPDDETLRHEFPTYAAVLHASDPVVRVVQIFPPTGGELAHPADLAPGLAPRTLQDLLQDTRPAVRLDVHRAITTRAMTISNPFELREGGIGVAQRLAVHEGEALWGIVTVISDVVPLLQHAGITGAERLHDLDLAVSDSNDSVFYGSASVLTGEPVRREVSLIEGTWTISARPRTGWDAAIQVRYRTFQAIAAVVALLLGFATERIVFRQVRLEATVRARTRELSSREQEYRLLFQQAADGILILDTALHIRQVNAAACAMLGYSEQHLMQLRWPDLLPDSTPFQFQGLQPGHTVVGEHHARHKDGSLVDIEASARVLPDGRIQTLVRDITARRRAESQLRQRETLLRIAGHCARIGGWIVHLAEERVIWSDEVAAIHEEPAGYSPSLADGILYYAPEWRDRIHAAFSACARDGIPYDEEMQIITARGRRIWIRTVGEAVRDGDGNIRRVQGAFQDISDRKNAEAALRASEERYRALIDNSPLAIFINRHDRVVLVNKACLKLFAAEKPEQLLGKSPYQLFDASVHALVQERIRRLRDAGESAPPAEERIVRVDGSLVDVEVSAAPFEDQGTRAIHVVVRDISERKRSEEALAQARQHLEENERRLSVLNISMNEAQAAASVGTWEWDMTRNTVWWSAELYRIFGVSEAGYVPSVAANAERLHPDDREPYHAEVRRIIADGGTLDVDVRVITPDHTIKFCNSRGRIERNAAGKPIRFTGTIMDITERKLAEMERQRSYDLLAKLAAQVPGVVYQYRLYPDGHSCFPYSSSGMREIFEREPEHVRNDATPVFERLHPDDRDRVTAEILISAERLLPFHCEFRVVLPRQGLRWRLSDAQPERAADGGTLWHGIITDITDRKRAEQALRDTVAEKEALLREVHHRVKNNLQVITSLLRLQSAREGDTGVREVLGEMQARVRSMALLHETLHRADNLASVDLAAYIESICNHLSRATNRRDGGAVRLMLDLRPVLVTADQAAPCGLIANELVSNALKHAFPSGRAGTVRIELRHAEGGEVALLVADDGVGLPPDFDRLRECSLGLQLVSDLCKQLDGALEIPPGLQTVFRVRFVPKPHS